MRPSQPLTLIQPIFFLTLWLNSARTDGFSGPFRRGSQSSNMKVVILCGGKGTRLREETEFRPKPMVPIGPQPILWHIMKYYAHFGHKEFILCLGYKGDMIKDYFRNYLWNTCDISLSLGRNSKVRFHDRHTEEDWIVTLADTGADSMPARR